MGSVSVGSAFRRTWLAGILFVLYGTTIPFAFVPDVSVAREHLTQALQSATSPSLLSKTDIVQNVLLYVPIGFLGVGALYPRRVRAMVLSIATAGALSVICELLQLFTIDRSTSLWDVWADLAGAVIGAFAFIVLHPVAIRALDALPKSNAARRRILPVIGAVAVVVIAAIEPFDITLDVGTVWSKVKPFVTEGWWRSRPITDELLTVVRFAILASLTTEWLKTTWTTTSPRARAVAGCVLLAVALEGTQFFLTSRSPAVQDVIAAVIGALAGISAVPLLLRFMRPAALLTISSAIAAIPFYLQPFDVSPRYGQISWMPFLGYYQFTTMQTVSHVIELMSIYAPIGFIAVWRRGPEAMTRALVSTGIIAAALEYSQGWIAGRYPDVTDLAVAVLGAFAGAVLASRGAAFAEPAAITT